MGKIKRPSIFRRKRYARVSGGEFIMTAEQQKAYEARKRIEQGLDALVASETIVTEDEVAEVVAKAIGEKFRRLNEMATKKPKLNNCPNCGAPLKDGKCEYCGTNYN